MCTFWHISFAHPCRMYYKQIFVLFLEKYQPKYLHRWTVYTINGNNHRISPGDKGFTVKFANIYCHSMHLGKYDNSVQLFWCHCYIKPIHWSVSSRVNRSDWHILVYCPEEETYPIYLLVQPDSHVVHTLPKGFTVQPAMGIEPETLWILGTLRKVQKILPYALKSENTYLLIVYGRCFHSLILRWVPLKSMLYP